MKKSSNYNPAGFLGNYGHQDLNIRCYENLNGFRRNPNVSHGQNSNIDPNGGQHHKQLNADNVGEAGRIFQDNQGFKHDNFNVGDEHTKYVSSLRNPDGQHPEFAATNKPLKSTVTSFETNQMPDINDSRNDVRGLPHWMVDVGYVVSHRTNEVEDRCQRIIDALEIEDKHGPKGPDNRSVYQSRNENANRPC